MPFDHGTGSRDSDLQRWGGLNDKLVKVSSTAADMATQWRDYRGALTRWNHVRTVACLLSAAVFVTEMSR